MRTEALIDALQHLKVETGSLACDGCGHEHNCSTKGCAIIREATARLEYLLEFFSEKSAQDLSTQIVDVLKNQMVDTIQGRMKEIVLETGQVFNGPVSKGDVVWMVIRKDYESEQRLPFNYFVEQYTVTAFNIKKIQLAFGKTAFWTKDEAIARMYEMRQELYQSASSPKAYEACLRKSDYDETWLAYRHKPEEV